VNLHHATALVLVAASALDYGIGDPWGWLHPVQVMGWYISGWSQLTWRFFKSPGAQKLAGVGLCASLVLFCGLGSWWFFHYLWWWQPGLAIALEAILLASCLAARSLRAAAIDVLEVMPDPPAFLFGEGAGSVAPPLGRGDAQRKSQEFKESKGSGGSKGAKDLEEARVRLSKYVGRDTDNLTVPEIYRSILETVAENAIDGATAPWFYALLGAVIGIGPLPLAVAYKAASTLDSMVGYRRSPYEHLGWASAKFEDMVTWLPCRLTVLTLGLISGRPLAVWRICQRDATHDPSPNSGWSECIYAAILGVQLGGDNYYKGELKSKPLLGDDLMPIDVGVIDRALNLTRSVLLVWLTIAIVGLYWLG
jgi:adenosylcobinamide-phosphate synthase